ncbi:transposase family protein [Amycolatopsis pretoriensis]|uniref:transposase family protein n=1 Tax=Amycolatopsis pretoriensis TaxID=218821 RepID=UPI000A364C55
MCGTPANTAASAGTCSSWPPQTGSRSGSPQCCPAPATTFSAARDLGITGALTAAAAAGLPTLADKAYHAAGIGIRTPAKKTAAQPLLNARQRVYNLLQSRARALGERAMAILKTRWSALHRISLCPHRIGAIVQAALVQTHHEHQGRY